MNTDDAPTSPETVRDVDVREAEQLAQDGRLVLDVREDEEWKAGHMPGAVHVPLAELETTPLEASRPIVAVCRSGNRSRKAAIALAERGIDVVNMAGGMKAWQDAGLPVVTDDGRPGTI